MFIGPRVDKRCTSGHPLLAQWTWLFGTFVNSRYTIHWICFLCNLPPGLSTSQISNGQFWTSVSKEVQFLKPAPRNRYWYEVLAASFFLASAYEGGWLVLTLATNSVRLVYSLQLTEQHYRSPCIQNGRQLKDRQLMSFSKNVQQSLISNVI